ncbi:MAG TPA: hypothetical protein VIG69_03520 [Candidatus Methylomirabilis sp.]|jgi:hypothetical protein
MQKLLCAVILVLGAGCATSADLVREKDEGTARRYPVTADQAWDITKTIFRWAGAEQVDEHRAEGYIVATDAPGRVDYGTLMVAWVERDPDGVMRVIVRTQSRMRLNPAVVLTEEGFHRRFVQAMSLVQEGKPLPAKPPD